MKLPARSSGLYWVKRTGCSAPAVFAARGVPTEDIFGVGDAAHGIRAALTRDPRPVYEVVNDAAAELMVAGPPFDGVKKPAIPPDMVAEAAQLMLRWVDKHGRPSGEAEVGFAVDRHLQSCDYDSPDAAWRSVVDLYEIDSSYDEEWGREITVLRWDDAKTAWPDTDTESLQMHGQGVNLVAAIENRGKKVDRLEMAKSNLRRRWHNVETFEGPRLDRKLAQWRDEISWWIKAWEKMPDDIEQAARPGAGCAECPYALVCEPSKRHFEARGIPATPEGIGIAWSAAKGRVAELQPYVKGLVADGDLKIPGGIITQEGSEKRHVLEGAGNRLVTAWEEQGGEARDLPEMLALGVGNFDALPKAVAEEEADFWKEFVADQIEYRKSVRLRIIPDPKEPQK